MLYDPLTGMVLYEKDACARRSMASTTKIMTALVALEIYDPEAAVVIDRAWTGIEGSSMYLKAGEQMQILDLLYGLMLMSGNDAAVALASLLTGNADDFVTLMNRKAQELGLRDTAFANPNGLEAEGHYSTAYDMAQLMAAAMENALFREIAGTSSCNRAGRYMRNHNKLLTGYDGCTGGKTGFTRKAGRCLVSSAMREGRQLIAVTLNAPDDWNDHAALYDQAFAEMERVQLCTGGSVGEVPVAGGREERCALYIEQGFALPLFSGERAQIALTIEGPRMIYGPVQAGDPYGCLKVYLGEQVLFTTPIYYKTEICAAEKPTAEGGFRRWLQDRIFGSGS